MGGELGGLDGKDLDLLAGERLARRDGRVRPRGSPRSSGGERGRSGQCFTTIDSHCIPLLVTLPALRSCVDCEINQVTTTFDDAPHNVIFCTASHSAGTMDLHFLLEIREF
jgi:hypothetical protein